VSSSNGVDSAAVGSGWSALSDGAAEGGTSVEVGEGVDGSKVGEADGVGVGVETMKVGVKVGRGVAVELTTVVGVGEENLTGSKVEVGNRVARDWAMGKSARLQASRKMVKTSRAGNRDIAC
jgi:hypothetical protein